MNWFELALTLGLNIGFFWAGWHFSRWDQRQEREELLERLREAGL